MTREMISNRLLARVFLPARLIPKQVSRSEDGRVPELRHLAFVNQFCVANRPRQDQIAVMRWCCPTVETSPAGWSDLFMRDRKGNRRQVSAAISTVLIILFLTGCRGSQVAFHEMSPSPTASLAKGTLTVHLGVITNQPVSEVWIGHRTRITDHALLVSGYQSFNLEQSKDFTVSLPKTMDPGQVPVFWVNPDGGKIRLPIAK